MEGVVAGAVTRVEPDKRTPVRGRTNRMDATDVLATLLRSSGVAMEGSRGKCEERLEQRGEVTSDIYICVYII